MPSASWTSTELLTLKSLKTPHGIQAYLTALPYNHRDECRSPRYVLRNRRAHCFDGALFAAAALWVQGHPPFIMDLRAVNDDDHVLAVFRKGRCWGAIAKSNFTTIQYREPVYRTLRELAMSYFDMYFNTAGEKTLREYSVTLDLRRFDDRQWMTTEEDQEYIGEHLDGVRHYRILPKGAERRLGKVDGKLLKAGL